MNHDQRKVLKAQLRKGEGGYTEYATGIYKSLINLNKPQQPQQPQQ